MTIAYIDVAKAPVQVPVIDLLGEPEGSAFDFVNSKAWIVDKKTPANTMLRDIRDVLLNPAASQKYVRNKAGILEPGPWWRCHHAADGRPLGLNLERKAVNSMTLSKEWNRLGGGDSSSIITEEKADLPPIAGVTSVSRCTKSETATTRFYQYGSGVQEVGLFNTRHFLIKPLFGLTNFGMESSGGGEYQFRYFIETGAVTMGANTGKVTVTKLLGGWYHCEVTPLAVAANASKLFLICADGAVAGQPGAFLSAAYQSEGGSNADSFATSYIPTEGAAVTRAEDSVILNTALIPINKTGSGNTIVFDIEDYKATSTQRVIGPAFVRANDLRAVAELYAGGTFISQVGLPTGTGTITAGFNPGLVKQRRYKIALMFKSGKVVRVVDGVVSSPAEQNVEFVENDIGRLVFGGQLNGGNNRDQALRTVKIVPRFMTVAEAIRETMPS